MCFIKNVTSDLKWRYKSLKRSLINLVRWLPIIWKDRDWDKYYLETMLIAKLNQMATYFDTYGHHTYADYHAAKMRTASKLLLRIQDDYYSSEYTTYYQQDFNIRPDGLLEWIEPINDNLGQYFDRYPKAYKYVIDNFKDSADHKLSRVGIAIRMGYYLEGKARKTAYNIISNYSPSWWD